jgi:hypothetical protein
MAKYQFNFLKSSTVSEMKPYSLVESQKIGLCGVTVICHENFKSNKFNFLLKTLEVLTRAPTLPSPGTYQPQACTLPSRLPSATSAPCMSILLVYTFHKRPPETYTRTGNIAATTKQSARTVRTVRLFPTFLLYIIATASVVHII